MSERILGYANRLSARPGEELDLMVSTSSEHFELSFARLTGPAGAHGGGREPVSGATVAGRHPGMRQEIAIGSRLDVASLPALAGFSVELSFQPTLLDDQDRGLIAWRQAGDPGLFASRRGLCLRLATAAGEVGELWLDGGLVEHEWHHVEASYDAETGLATLAARSHPRMRPAALDGRAEGRLATGMTVGPTELSIGAGWLDGRRGRNLNGKLARPRVVRAADGAGRAEVVAEWDFSRDQAAGVVADVSGNGHDATVVNCPTRAVTGPDWSGHELDFRRAPEEYDAIHFHEDALESCGWEVSTTLVVPDDWRSGIYVAVVSDTDSTDEIPFYVRPRPGEESDVLFLAPTNTYLAYANDRNFEQDLLESMKGDPIVPDDNDVFLAEHPELGLSLYDRHRDGVGCMYSSRLRPILNMRPGRRNWLTGTVRHFDADLILIQLLERNGIEYSVATDEDLDAEGVAALEAHRVVLTGSHPEYSSSSMLDGIEEYLAAGGRLMYLGGNGFYWVTSYSPRGRHLIEVRRAITGNRNFGSPVGESHHSTTGEHGGIWRLRGRAPNTIAGVGFTANGWAEGRPYERVDGAADPRWSWIFDGIAADEPIGAGGSVLGAAGGDEIDRCDVSLGSPRHATVLAVASGFSDYYQPVLEDHDVYAADQGGASNPDVRADMVAYETPNGGAVFSVGSICWIGSLTEDDYRGSAARVTLNTLRRFAGGSRVVDPNVEAAA